MCPKRVLWLLSFVGLSVALALGGRQPAPGALEPRAPGPRPQPRDWPPLGDERPALAGRERLALLDDTLADALGEQLRRRAPDEGPLARARRSRPTARRRGPADKAKRRISASRRQQQMPQQNPQEAAQALAQAGQSMAASSFMFNSRNDRSYDVPLIECPMSEDGMERFACPTADRMGRYHCIDDHVLCDGYLDCPMGEDEDMQACMFYKTTKAHIDILADALLRWARGR